MKRFFKLLLISVLAAITAFGFSACDGLNIRLPWNGCGSDSGDNTKTSVQPILIEDNSQTEFTMKIIEKDSFESKNRWNLSYEKTFVRKDTKVKTGEWESLPRQNKEAA